MSSDPMKLVVYHDDCVDGFTAAWVAKRSEEFKDATLVPAKYGDDPPDVKDKIVLVVDFSYPRDVMERMFKDASALTVLDHHKTAEADCRGLPFCVFDTERCGAMLTWDYIHGEHPPRLVWYVQDRDLWKMELPRSKAVSAYIQATPFDLLAWDALADSLQHGLDNAENCGQAILAYQERSILLHMRRARPGYINGTPLACPIVNVTDPGITSELLHRLAEADPSRIAAGWFQEKGVRTFSLRSMKDGPDVSVIAKANGGGGHKHAAGFRR